MSHDSSIATAHFDAMYERSPDPWQFETSDYERRKYALTLEALPRLHYARGFELGCSIGVLTALLADRCDSILGGDCSSKAIALAQLKQAHRSNARFATMRAPMDLPDARFDLIVLSEVLYFLCCDDLKAVAAYCARALQPAGTIVVVNYLGATDTEHSGDDAATLFLRETASWTDLESQIRQPDFRLEILVRKPTSTQSDPFADGALNPP